jgi:hypothetical protein
MTWLKPTLLWLALVTLVLGDVVTTTINLDAGMVELNPYMQAVVIDPLLHLVVKILFIGVVALLSYASGRIGHPHAPVAAAAGMFSMPVCWNIVVTLF